MPKCNLTKIEEYIKMEKYQSFILATLALVSAGGLIYGSMTDEKWSKLREPNFENLRRKFGITPGLPLLQAESKVILIGYGVLCLACLLFWISGLSSGIYFYTGKRMVHEKTLEDLQDQSALARNLQF